MPARMSCEAASVIRAQTGESVEQFIRVGTDEPSPEIALDEEAIGSLKMMPLKANVLTISTTQVMQRSSKELLQSGPLSALLLAARRYANRPCADLRVFVRFDVHKGQSEEDGDHRQRHR
jgi:hypothetical protein